jgi:hypothetical protein
MSQPLVFMIPAMFFVKNKDTQLLGIEQFFLDHNPNADLSKISNTQLFNAYFLACNKHNSDALYMSDFKIIRRVQAEFIENAKLDVDFIRSSLDKAKITKIPNHKSIDVWDFYYTLPHNTFKYWRAGILAELLVLCVTYTHGQIGMNMEWIRNHYLKQYTFISNISKKQVDDAFLKLNPITDALLVSRKNAHKKGSK